MIDYTKGEEVRHFDDIISWRNTQRRFVNMVGEKNMVIPSGKKAGKIYLIKSYFSEEPAEEHTVAVPNSPRLVRLERISANIC